MEQLNAIERYLDELPEIEVDGQAAEQIAALVNRQLELEELKAQVDDIASTLSKQIRELNEKQIPDAMAEIGMESFTMQDGSKVEIKNYYSGSVVSDESLDWLRNNGHGDLIKHDVSAHFGMGEDSKALELKEILHGNNLNYTEKVGVHSATLKAFIREQCEAGDPPPKELFKTFIGNKTKITKPRRK